MLFISLSLSIYIRCRFGIKKYLNSTQIHPVVRFHSDFSRNGSSPTGVSNIDACDNETVASPMLCCIPLGTLPIPKVSVTYSAIIRHCISVFDIGDDRIGP